MASNVIFIIISFSSSSIWKNYLWSTPSFSPCDKTPQSFTIHKTEVYWSCKYKNTSSPFLVWKSLWSLFLALFLYIPLFCVFSLKLKQFLKNFCLTSQLV